MPEKYSLSQLEDALTLLGDRLRLAGLPPQELIVCGGTSLNARGFVSRTTKDVDVLARKVRGADFISAKELPKEFVAAAKRVAADLGLPEDWINSDAVDLFEMGMPEGFRDRLEPRDYGYITVWYIGRIDQIHLKLYAAVDLGASRHVTDLMALRPTEAELLTAAHWTMTHDVSPGFKGLLMAFLRELNHDKIAEQL